MLKGVNHHLACTEDVQYRFAPHANQDKGLMKRLHTAGP
jgi:hypothetical protein